MFELFQNHRDGTEDCFQQIMNTCDLDGDGKLDYGEFIQATVNHKAILN
jgi:Ca2+-binding EF-hand superfamily protein